MAMTNLEKIYVVDMTNVETNVVTALPSAFVSLDAAYAFIEECKRTDQRTDSAGCWKYRVRTFTLFR